MTIKWVHDNIQAFGGNLETINIFGQSTGASSIALHLLYNKDHIKSGIMESPTFFLQNTPSHYLADSYPAKAENLGEYLKGKDANCPGEECVTVALWRKVDFKHLLTFQSQVLPLSSDAFFPTFKVKGSEAGKTFPLNMVHENLMKAFKAAPAGSIPPFIIGHNHDEWWSKSVPPKNGKDDYNNVVKIDKELFYVDNDTERLKYIKCNVFRVQ